MGRIINRAVALIAGLLAIATSPLPAAPSYDFDRAELEAVLEDLKAWLPGAWDSAPQLWYERNVTMPEGGEHEAWHRTFWLIDAPQVGEVVFYGQINIGGRDGPVMPRSEVVYRVWIDEARNAVVMNGQPPADAARFRNLGEHPELWAEVRMRDPDALNCDFLWRRDGEQLMAVLEGKTEEKRKYGPGTCTYVNASGAEFYADAEWVLTPEELWVYDTNKIRGVLFIGREDQTHTRLYRTRPYTCTLAGRIGKAGEVQVLAAHDRGFTAPLTAPDGQALRMRLLRARYPAADGFGLDDELRLTLHAADGAEPPLATVAGAPQAPRIELAHAGVQVSCVTAERLGRLGPAE